MAIDIYAEGSQAVARHSLSANRTNAGQAASNAELQMRLKAASSPAALGRA